MNKPKVCAPDLDDFFAELSYMRDEYPIDPVAQLSFFTSVSGRLNSEIASDLGITCAAYGQALKRETDGCISVRTLKKIANALNADFVYFIIPRP